MEPQKPKRSIMTASPTALEQIKVLLNNRGKPSAGIRIGVNTKGCSGMSYILEYADVQEPGSETVEIDGIKLFIDPKAMLFVIGTEIDYVKDTMQSGFTFNNPNAKGLCGCGKSFTV